MRSFTLKQSALHWFDATAISQRRKFRTLSSRHLQKSPLISTYDMQIMLYVILNTFTYSLVLFPLRWSERALFLQVRKLRKRHLVPGLTQLLSDSIRDPSLLNARPGHSASHQPVMLVPHWSWASRHSWNPWKLYFWLRSYWLTMLLIRAKECHI